MPDENGNPIWGINPKQLKFAENFASGMSQSEAYAEAYGHPKDKPHISSMAATLLKRNPKIMEVVNKMRAKSAKRVGITIDELIGKLAEIMRAEVRTEKATKQGVVELPPDFGERIRAIEALGRHLGMFNADKSNTVDKIEVTFVRKPTPDESA